MARRLVASIPDYLAALPPDRRKAIAAVRKVIRANLPPGFKEGPQYGMIGYYVPLSRFPDTYNGQPLAYVSLASQKRHNALYLMGLYSDSDAAEDFRRRWTEDGRRLDMGKSCLRFQDPADLRSDLVAEVVAATPPDRLIELHQQARAGKR